MTQGTGMAMVTSIFPASERGKGIGSHASVVGTGGVMGPIAGGFLITALDWRWLFYINIFMGLATIIVVLLIIRSDVFRQDSRNRSYDYRGAALSTAVLLTFLLAVSNGTRMGWTSPPIILSLIGFVVFLVAFVRWELRSSSPMLDMTLFRSKVFSIGIGTNFMSFLGITSSRFLLPFYLQAALGYTPALVGFALLPNAASRIIMGPLSGRLSDRYGWRALQHHWPFSLRRRAANPCHSHHDILDSCRSCGNTDPEYRLRPLSSRPTPHPYSVPPTPRDMALWRLS